MVGTTGHPRAAREAAALEREAAAVYREHSATLLRYAASVRCGSGAAQDAVQEAFLRYVTARAAGKPVEDPGPWLRRVVHNVLVDSARSAAVRAEIAGEAAPEARAPGIDPERACGSAE